MNEQTPPVAPDAPAAATSSPVPPAAAHHNPVANVIARMSITQMTLAVVLVLFLWQWFDAHRQINNMQQELARRLSEMEGNNKASQMLVAQGQEATRELGAKVALLEAHYAESESQRAALDTLYQALSSSRDETTLAQVEQMLLIAGQQLQLSGNVKAALIAMQQADDYLKRMDKPSLAGLRSTISRDMEQLQQLPSVDTPSINLRLDNLIAKVDALPLEQDVQVRQENDVAVPAASGAPAWQTLLHEIWNDAKHLVRIENMEKQELPLLPPTQIFFLRENLKLRLLSARLALLSHDEASYKRDLQTAQDWITRYFNVKSAEGTSALATLQTLHSSKISIDMPDISASLAAVRNYRITREKPAR